jgi:adenylate cyclase
VAEERVQRRLAAILAADVVGYSRLIRADESGTRSRYNAHLNELIEPSIAEHGGRTVKTTGDGFLVEFASVVDAVQCSAQIQRAMPNRNAGEPEDRSIAFRIGINLGDVIIEGDDIHGDGVNVASRLEGLSEAGGICISAAVYDQVRDRIDLVFEDLGDQEVKNINRPVRVWRWTVDASTTVQQSARVDAPLRLPDQPSIAVLPFENMSGDPEQEYFSDGITEDIITALSHIRWFFVTAGNSSFSFKGQSPDVQHVVRELGVRYLVQGSVRKAGNRIRVTAQLIEAETGNHIWAERYDREITDIFDLQDELTETLVGAIAPGIGNAERQRAKQNPPDNLGVWDLYQRGMWHLRRRTRGRMEEELHEARALFEKAMKLNPEFGPAYAAYAETFYYDAMWGSREDNRVTALQAARKAVELDSEDANAHVALGKIYRLSLDYDAAEAEHKIALTLNPSLADAHYYLSGALLFSGKAQEAIPHVETAIRLSPHDDLIGPFHSRLAEAHLYLGNHEEAAELAQKALRLPGTQWGGYAKLASALGHLGRIEDAKKALEELKAIQPQANISLVKQRFAITDARYIDNLLDGLRKAGLPE